MSLRQRVESVLNQNKKTLEQQDQEHREWIATGEGIVEVIKNPILGIVPSQRTVEDNRDILIARIKRDYGL